MVSEGRPAQVSLHHGERHHDGPASPTKINAGSQSLVAAALEPSDDLFKIEADKPAKAHRRESLLAPDSNCRSRTLQASGQLPVGQNLHITPKITIGELHYVYHGGEI